MRQGSTSLFSIITLWVTCLLLVAAAFSQSHASTILVRSADIQDVPHGQQIALEIAGASPIYRVFTLPSPPRLVVDMEGTRLAPNFQTRYGQATEIRDIRHAVRESGVLRVVFDLSTKMQIHHHKLTPEQSGHHTLAISLRDMGAPPVPVIGKALEEPEPQEIIDDPLYEDTLSLKPQFGHRQRLRHWHRHTNSTSEAVDQAEERDVISPFNAIPELKPTTSAGWPPVPVAKGGASMELSLDELPVSGQKRRIVIDAGHGGIDPGAIGVSGIKEKEITLRFALALKKALEDSGRYEAVLTRIDDYFLPLRERIRVARQNGGELFLSLHADAAPSGKARGFSVYTLSEKASDEEAELLAQQENKVDILAGVDLSSEDDDVAGILIDLAQRETKNKSSLFAETIIKTLRDEVHMRTNTHRFAGFAVLKSPDIPSVLIELGFLTNREDERILRKDKAFERRVVKGLVQAIDRYYAER